MVTTEENNLPGDIEQNEQDYKSLKQAVRLLTAPSLTAQLTDLLGGPLDWAVKKLPSGAQQKIHKAVEAALHKSVTAALWTMDKKGGRSQASTKLHTLAAAVTGAAGGFFGLAGMAVELPLTTTLIMRSIADVARSEGFDLSDLDVQMQCVAVFGLGGKQTESADTGYFAVRAGLHRFAGSVAAEIGEIVAAEAAAAAAKKITEKQAAKWLAEMITKVAARFEIVVTEKMALQAAPVIGAGFGATLNALFINFYQNMARGHFIVNRLADKYGEEPVKDAYQKLAKGG